ncbi:MAG: nitroreductase family protein [Ktedonobacteraceae bacterium]
MTTHSKQRLVTLPIRTDTLATLIRSRRSVRQFQDRPVDRELIEEILEAARWAPSPHGRQPWRFVVLTRPELKTLLADRMGDTWQRNLEMDGQDSEIVNVRLDKSRQRILKAPVIIIPCLYLEELDRYPDERRQADETTMAIQSIGAAIQNMLLVAYDLGLDAGWMCAPLFCPEVVVDALPLDTRLIPQAMITVGYAAADPKRRDRLPLSSLIVRFD